MKITLIGTGNVATVLGRKFVQAGHEVLQVYGRQQEVATQLAEELHSSAVTDLHSLHPSAELYIIAVADAAIPQVAAALSLNHGIVVHTAGSVSKEVLRECSEYYGVLYPLQSMRKEMDVLPDIPFLVDANTDAAIEQLKGIAHTLSGQVQVADDEQRLKLHLAAVMVSNFTNHLYALADDYCREEKVDFRLLIPLITEVAQRLHRWPPAEMQTGPAVRDDEGTIRKHLDLLKDHTALRNLYRLFTDSIRDMYK